MKVSKNEIAELYEEILNRYVVANGHVLMENVTIPIGRTSPDKLWFDGVVKDYDSGGRAFAFIGNDSDVIGYVNNSSGTHVYIFNGMLKTAQDPAKQKTIFKDYGISVFGKLTPENLSYYVNEQKEGILSDTRTKTRSGRLWKNLHSKTANKNVDIVVFWCRVKDVRPDDLKYLKKYFKLGDMFWAASDSKNFIFYGDDYRESGGREIKELKSKIFPELTHDQIVDILMRAHSNFRMSNSEKRVVWEFRGIDPLNLKSIDGGYPTTAEYNYNSRLSESSET